MALSRAILVVGLATCYAKRSPQGCAAPTGIPNAHPAGACVEGDAILSDGTCTGQCATGFVPHIDKELVAQLKCHAGVLSPRTFVCAEPLAIPYPGVKRGIGIGFTGRPQVHDWGLYDHSVVSWWFDWYPKPSGVGGAFPADELKASNFVPMVKERRWLGPKLSEVAVVSPYLMGFNEPYGPTVNMKPQEVTDDWPQLEQKALEMAKELGKPVEILTPSITPHGSAFEWAKEYKTLMDAAGNRYDAVLLDFYCCTATDLKKGLDRVYALFQKPIWLKEFNCGDGPVNATAEKHLAYMKEALPVLEAHPHVVRYSWMASTAPSHCPGASLIDATTHTMTELGHYYNTAPRGAAAGPVTPAEIVLTI